MVHIVDCFVIYIPAAIIHYVPCTRSYQMPNLAEETTFPPTVLLPPLFHLFCNRDSIYTNLAVMPTYNRFSHPVGAFLFCNKKNQFKGTVSRDFSPGDQTTSPDPFKGTVSRDFLYSVFFTNQLLLVPLDMSLGHFDFFAFSRSY